MPSSDFSPLWQTYFEVKNNLPNITGSLPRSFAGNIPVDRPGHPNDTLFFWGFEHRNGSLTESSDEDTDEPWLIWLQGGPGSSSMTGLMTENGPIHVLSNYSLILSNNSWNHLVDAIWIDQPVGTGYSTSDRTGYSEFLASTMTLPLLNRVQSQMRTKWENAPAHRDYSWAFSPICYAGTYIPYITKHLFSVTNSPVNLRKIAIGDGSLGSLATIRYLPVLNVIETYPQLINYDEEVFSYFRKQHHLCGFDLNLTYPQDGHFPTLQLDPPGIFFNTSPQRAEKRIEQARRSFTPSLGLKERSSIRDIVASSRTEHKRNERKRDLAGRSNGSIDPYYGCHVFDEMLDYAMNFSFPWSNGNFDVYDIPDGTNPEPPLDASVFLNGQPQDDRTRAALHAPISKNWTGSFSYPFGSVHNLSIGNEHGDPSVEPIAFLSELAANATSSNVSIVFYSGNDDSLVQHRGTQVIIQNMTFGGIQGFMREPSTPWFDDDGNFAGIVHQERNLTYVLFEGAGHLVPEWKPAAAFVFLREFVLGSNETGLVINSTVVGGENSTLADDVLPGGNLFYYGSGATAGTSTVPLATQEAWKSFVATATASATTTAQVHASDAVRVARVAPGFTICLLAHMVAIVVAVLCVL